MIRAVRRAAVNGTARALKTLVARAASVPSLIPCVVGVCIQSSLTESVIFCPALLAESLLTAVCIWGWCEQLSQHRGWNPDHGATRGAMGNSQSQSAAAREEDWVPGQFPWHQVPRNSHVELGSSSIELAGSVNIGLGSAGVVVAKRLHVGMGSVGKAVVFEKVTVGLGSIGELHCLSSTSISVGAGLGRIQSKQLHSPEELTTMAMSLGNIHMPGAPPRGPAVGTAPYYTGYPVPPAMPSAPPSAPMPSAPEAPPSYDDSVRQNAGPGASLLICPRCTSTPPVAGGKFCMNCGSPLIPTGSG